MRQYVFEVRIFQGRRFPRELSALLLSATFAGETKFKSVVKGTTRTAWNSPLQLSWQLDTEQLRAVNNSGNCNCKLTCSDVSNGNSLGWVVMDLRTAKLNGAKRDAGEGVWVPLVGVQPEMSSDPELSLFYTFREKGYEPDPLLAEGEVKALERELERAAEAKEREEQALGSPPSNDPAPPQANVGVERPASDTPSTPGDEDAAQQPTGTPSGIQPPGADFTRKFKLTIDLRSIKVLRIVPSNLASVYVQAFLPKAAKRVFHARCRRPFPAPLKTYPSMHVARGSETGLPNGLGEVEFVTDVMTLASLLAGNPHVIVEVWYKEGMKKDVMLGMASVPMSVLLEDPSVDRYAAVYALVSYPGEKEKKTQVAAVRVVLSLEELGVSWTPGDPVPLLQTAGAASYVQGRVLAIEERHQQAGAADVKAKDLPSAGPKESNSVNEPQQGEPNLPKMVPSTEELETAYELEMWKAEQEKKWRAELREREAERLSILESEWRHRESLRDAEFSARKEAYGKLEARAREVLKEMAAREAKLVAAEEAAASRRGELERAAATRISEAEAAVRRLQVECEHQLDLERHRNEELARAKAAAEERLRAAEARADAVEVAFQQYRDSQRHSPESELQAKLSEAQSALRQAEAKAREAIFAKGRYKEQVVKLAKELAALQKARAEEQSQLLASRLSHMDDITTRRISSSQAKMSRVQASELGALRLQLEELRKSAAAAQRAVVSNGKENSNPQLSTSPPRPQTAEAAAPDLPEIQRLQKERASLLDTGMYDAGDPLIQEIDRQMQALQDPRPQR